MKIKPSKTIIFIIASLFIGFVVFNNLEQKETLKSVDKPKPYYGEVVITTQVDGLQLNINEKEIAKLEKNKEFVYEFTTQKGSGDFGYHELVFYKDLSDKEEYYLKTLLSFSDDELRHKKRKALDIVASDYDYLKNKDYKPSYERISIRTKPSVKLQQTGLIQKLKLKHNRSYTMAVDEKNLYILTIASDNLYNTSQNEKETGNFLEVYELASLELKHYVKLGTLNHYDTIEVNDTHIYIGTRNAYVMNSAKDDPFSNRPFKVLENKGHRGKINGIKAHKEYLFVYDEGGNIVVFKNNKYLYMIQTYPKIAPKTKYILEANKWGSLFDLEIKENIIYASNDLGIIYMFAFSQSGSKFIGGFETAEYDKEKNRHDADDIPDMIFYNQNLLFSREYSGLSSYNTKTDRFNFTKKTLYPKKIVYSEILEEDIDITPSTNISQMVLYKDHLIFHEHTKKISVYSFKEEKIVHTFEGVSDDVFDIEVVGKRLFSLGADGVVYVWDLGVIE